MVYYKNNLNSKSKFHITSDHQTLMGNIILFRPKEGDLELINEKNKNKEEQNFNHKAILQKFNFERDYLFVEELKNEKNVFALVLLEKELLCSTGG